MFERSSKFGTYLLVPILGSVVNCNVALGTQDNSHVQLQSHCPQDPCDQRYRSLRPRQRVSKTDALKSISRETAPASSAMHERTTCCCVCT